MKLFIDTEFTDFIGTELISIGLVSEDGKHEFYAEVTDYNHKLSSEFVKQTVEPLLDHSKFGMKESELSARLGSWLEELKDDYTICVDYQMDWELFCNLVENIPSNIDKQPFMLFAGLDANIYIKATQIGIPDLPWFHGECRKQFYEGFLEYFLRNNKKQHHALDDAKANRIGWIKAHEWLQKHY